MSPVRRFLPILALLLAAPPASGGRPPPQPIELPGEKLGEARTTWIAPWVSHTVFRVGGGWSGTIRWHDRAGDVVRRVEALLSISGHVPVPRGGRLVYLALNGDWGVTLEDRPGSDRYVTGTRDSRTLIHQFRDPVFHPRQSFA